MSPLQIFLCYFAIGFLYGRIIIFPPEMLRNWGPIARYQRKRNPDILPLAEALGCIIFGFLWLPIIGLAFMASNDDDESDSGSDDSQ